MREKIKTGINVALLAVIGIWTAGIVYYCLPAGGVLVWIYVAMIVGALAFCRKRKVLIAAWTMLLLLNVFYLVEPASNNKEWKASWSQLSFGEIEDDVLALHNVRNFIYRTTEDFDIRYQTRVYHLNDLETLDLVVCHWDGLESVAHTMLSFGFKGGRYLALSAETRVAEGDIQGSLPGLYNQFGLQYIFATEEDIFALRSNYRHEDLFLYRLTIPKEKIRPILEEFVARANKLTTHPEFYNTLTHNCTTALIPAMKKGVPFVSYNPAVLVNGFIDRRAYRMGGLLHKEGESFEELKKRSAVPYDISSDNLKRYSQKIREQVGILP